MSSVSFSSGKSGETVSSDAFASLDKVAALLKAGGMPPKTGKTIVYGGHNRWTQRETTVLPWGEIDRYDWLAVGRARSGKAASARVRG